MYINWYIQSVKYNSLTNSGYIKNYFPLYMNIFRKNVTNTTYGL